MPAAIEKTELSKLPYVLNLPDDVERQVFVLPYFESGSMHVPLIMPEGIIEIGYAGLVEGSYLSAEGPERPTDLTPPLLSTIVAHLSFPELVEAYDKIERDLINVAAFMEKYFILLDHYRGSPGNGMRATLACEFEGAVVNARALYDQIQLCWRSLWTKIIQSHKVELPGSFRKLAEMPAADLRGKYNLPDPFTEFVTTASPVFTVIRKLRVGVEHFGRSTTGFFPLESGLAVDVSQPPWRQFDIWPHSALRNGKLGCYLTFLAALACELRDTVANFERAIRVTVPLPAPITEWTVYLRSPVMRHYQILDQYVNAPWAEPATSLATSGNPS